jgi:DNA polymerase III alpha subunit (gram-positive type)
MVLRLGDAELQAIPLPKRTGLKYFVFDTETTGLVNMASANVDDQPQIIEFYGIVIDEDGTVLHEFERLYKNTKPLEPIITKITGLTDEKLIDAGEFDPAPIIEMLGKADVAIAHNLSFDTAMLGFEFARKGLKLKMPDRGVCTVEATQHIMGRRMKLGQLYQHCFKEEFVGGHRAAVDVKALARIVVWLIKKDMI